MILQGIREQAGLHIAKDTQTQPSQHSWVYQAIKELGKAKCEASGLITEPRTPTPELAWLLRHPHTPNIRNQSLLCYTIPQALHSLPVIFRGCGEEIQPSRFVCVVSKLGLSRKPIPHPCSQNSLKTNHCTHATTQQLQLNRGK